MKLYYTTDLHGSTKCWKKFLATPKYYQADVIVIGGDITGKLIVPIVPGVVVPLGTPPGKEPAAKAGKRKTGEKKK